MTSPLEAALSTILPPPEHALLLAACLREGHAAADSWSRFVAAVGDAKRYFEADATGLKGLLPFIESRFAANGVDAGKAFHTYARVALVREELRRDIVAKILGDLIEAADEQGIRFLLLKGAAVSATAYPQPSCRHVHAIDLLVDPRDWQRAQALLPQSRFLSVGAGPGAACHLNYKHWTGLALGLHCRPLFLPYFEMPTDAIESRARSIEIHGRRVRVMSPEDNLVHVCGHAVYARSRANLRWVCDAVWLLKRNPMLDWPLLVATAVTAGIAPALFVQLRWIDRMLQPVPSRWLEELRVLGQSDRGAGSERFYASLLHTTQSRRGSLRAFSGDWRTQLGFLRFSAFPSPRYMRWKHNVEGSWELAMHYVERPRRLAKRVAHVGSLT